MKTTFLSICLTLCCVFANAQSTAPSPALQSPSYANFSIMLVNPAGGAVVLMHNPKNALEYVDVSRTKEAFAAGYVPVRAAELGEFIASMQQELSRLSAENIRLQNAQSAQTSIPGPSQAQIDAQQRSQADAEKEERRLRMLQMWMMLGGGQSNQHQTMDMNVTVSDCSKNPISCLKTR